MLSEESETCISVTSLIFFEKLPNLLQTIGNVSVSSTSIIQKGEAFKKISVRFAQNSWFWAYKSRILA